jgi:A/G-specific adenine glycosylase
MVSELMLQQTAAAVAAAYFERFVAAFPDWESLAAAPERRVLAAWAGLGYYRRARHLHAAARRVVQEHGGMFPSEPEAVRALPGVGPYTAGAVLSLAFGCRVAAVDGNVGRVLSRHAGEPLAATRAADRRRLEALVLARQPARRPGDFNEALMELGALVCTPRAPACAACPVATDCVARRRGLVHALPPARARAPAREVRAAAAVILRGGRVLLRRRPDDAASLAGLWELPGGATDGVPAPRYLAEKVLPSLGGGDVVAPLGRVEHVITTRRITVELLACRLRGAPRVGRDLRWVAPRAAPSLGLTAATAKALPLALSCSSGPRPEGRGL